MVAVCEVEERFDVDFEEVGDERGEDGDAPIMERIVNNRFRHFIKRKKSRKIARNSPLRIAGPAPRRSALRLLFAVLAAPFELPFVAFAFAAAAFATEAGVGSGA